MSSRVDNGALHWKQAMRLRAVRGRDGLRVLDCFAGEGGLYRAVWGRFCGGACMDKTPAKAERAAIMRPRWACYCGDTIRSLDAGWMASVAWDVVDLDVYGSPWPALRAWMTSDRRRAKLTDVFLTDGYMRQASLVRPCSSLFGDDVERFTVSPGVYRSTVQLRLSEWCGDHLEVVEHHVKKARRLRLHHLVIRAD